MPADEAVTLGVLTVTSGTDAQGRAHCSVDHQLASGFSLDKVCPLPGIGPTRQDLTGSSSDPSPSPDDTPCTSTEWSFASASNDHLGLQTCKVD